VHGDIASGNLLVRDGRLHAVIDFGCSGVGDPACDTAIAWTFLSGEPRRVFRSLLPFDEATWARGRGWALWKALIVLVDALDNDPQDAILTQHVIDEVLAEHEARGAAQPVSVPASRVAGQRARLAGGGWCGDRVDPGIHPRKAGSIPGSTSWRRRSGRPR